MVAEKLAVDVAVVAVRKGPMWIAGAVVFGFGVAVQYNILLAGRSPWIGIVLTALGAAVFFVAVVKWFDGLMEAEYERMIAAAQSKAEERVVTAEAKAAHAEAKAAHAEAKAAHAEAKAANMRQRADDAEAGQRKSEEECAGLRAELQALRAQTGG